MLTFKNCTIAFCFALISLSVVHFFIDPVAIWYFLLTCFLYSLALTYGSIFIAANFYVKSISKGDSHSKEIAITFDDGPDANKTPLILDILKKNGVKATFFCIGKNIENQHSLLKRIDEEGHIIGNHSYSHHFFFDLKSSSKMFRELVDVNNLVEKAINKKLKLFRPPYGVTNPNLAKAIKKCGFTSIGWSVRSLDTVEKNSDKLLEKVVQVSPGDVVLFHDTSDTTVQMLDEYLGRVKALGFSIVGLDRLLNVQAYE